MADRKTDTKADRAAGRRKRNRRRLLLGTFVVVAAAAGGGAYILMDAQAEPAPTYRFATVERGPLVSTVTASGKVQALVTVVVGSQLSGQIKELRADFNDRVKKGQVIARLDTDHLEARLQQAKAELETARATFAMQQAQASKAKSDIRTAAAEIVRSQAALIEARRDNVRKQSLARRGIGSRADADKAESALRQAEATLSSAKAKEAAAKASYQVAEAQVASAKATVATREAAVRLVEVDLRRSEIRAPIDGVIVERNVDVGTTVAASLQAPTLFTIAQDLRKIEVHASVDEADIGRIAKGQRTSFTVNAFPNRTFRGTVKQIRLAPKEEQNVVTYTVIVSADNPDQLLLPGMTANLKVVSQQRVATLKVPNAALRFRMPGATNAAGPRRFSGRSGLSSKAMAERLAKQLELSPEQTRQIAGIIEETRTAMRALRDQRMRRQQRFQRFRAIRREGANKISAVLTAKQRERYASLRRLRANRSFGQLYVMDKSGTPKVIRVRVGITDGSFTEIRGRGIEAGTRVVISRSGGARRNGGGRPTRLRF